MGRILNFPIAPFVGFDVKTLEWEAEVNRGSQEYIRWVQQALNKILGLRLAVDGIVGPITRSAIRSFQQKYGLLVDGIVGPQTEQALIGAGAGHPPGISSSPYLPPAPSAQQGSTFHPSCNGAQQRLISLALKKAKQIVDRVVVRMQILSMDESSGSDQNYVCWFGAFDKGRAQYVRRTYQLIAKALKREIEFACDCDKQIYAHTFPGLRRKIHFCARFWSAPFSGLDSKPGVIIHELAHELLRGGDFRYSVGKAERLAAKSPWLAVRNADNYEYFAESLDSGLSRCGGEKATDE